MKSEELITWGKELQETHLPRWEELPELELYMDQVITLLDRYLASLVTSEKEHLLSSAMVNNYVKHKLIPAPVKKRYNRNHLAYLIAITLLKQVLAIPDIKALIDLQLAGENPQATYDLFCTKQEDALAYIVALLLDKKAELTVEVAPEYKNLAMESAARSFANKLLVEKMLELESRGNENG